MENSFKEFINIEDLPDKVEIIKTLNGKIRSLERERNSSNNSEEINRLRKENNDLKKQNNDLIEKNNGLKEEIKNLKNKTNGSNDLISVIFVNRAQVILCSIICNKKDIFKNIEKKFFEKNPEYSEFESVNYTVRSNPIDKEKSLEDNNIRNSDLIQTDKDD